MDAKGLVDYVEKIEKSYPVDQWKYNDIELWPLVRVHLSFELRKTFVVGERANSRQAQAFMLLGNLIDFFKCLIFDSEHNAQLKKCDAIFFSYSVARQFQMDGRWFEVYVDSLSSILKKLNLKSVFLEYLSSYKVKYPRYGQSYLMLPQIMWAEVKARFTKNKYKSELPASWMELHRQLKKDFPNLDFRMFPNIHLYIARIFEISKFFEKVLKKTQPKFCFSVSYYNFVSMCLTYACKKSNVKVIELQHGVQGKNNITHSEWHRYPTQGWKLLPDYYFSWTQADVEIINAWTQSTKTHRAVQTGNFLVPFFKDAPSETIKGFESQMAKSLANYKKHVLISFQPGFDFQYFEDAIKQSPKDIFWWVRLHPSMHPQIAEYTMRLAKYKNADVERATLLPLYFLLEKMDFHATFNSTVVMDAVYFKVPSIVCDNTGSAFYEEQIKSHFVKYAKTPGDLVAEVTSGGLSVSEAVYSQYRVLNSDELKKLLEAL